jgi:integrase
MKLRLTAGKRQHIVVPRGVGTTIDPRKVRADPTGTTRTTMLAKKPLTARAIQSLKPAPAGKRRIVWDAVVPGLAVRVTDQGKRTFVLVTRYPGSRHPAPRALGAVGALTLEAARAKAREWLELIGSGVDPAVQAQQRLEQTFQRIAETYFQRKAAAHRSRRLTEATLARLVYPTFGQRPIDAISRSDIVRLLDRIEDECGPMMATRTLHIIGQVMNFHASRSDDFRSPIVKGMARGSEQPRSRILSDDELRAIWKATGDYPVFGPLLRFILLTATRRNEAGQMRWSELNGSEWTIPARRYKTNLDHVIPLSALALAVLPKRNGEFVFTGNGRQAIGGYERHKRAIDEASGVSGWVIHDLRRSARSLMSRAGVPSDHAERCLGHVISGVRGVYDRHEYYDEKAKAFEALAAQVQRIIDPQDNVVPIARPR